MSITYYATVTVHLLAAVVWLGGMLFLALVGAPVLRRVEPQPLRQELFRSLGLRFATVGWIAIATLLVTGTLLLALRGLLHWSVLGSADFWRSGFGHALALKLAAVALMLVLGAVHDVVSRRDDRLRLSTPEIAARQRRVAAITGRGAVLVGLLVVLAAVRLARGG